MAAIAKETKMLDKETLRNFPIANRYLIGVSGGRDSVALLHALLARGYGKLIVCHLDHRLRGKNSKADSRFVAALAKEHRLVFELGSADVAKRAKAGKQSIETAARDSRYAFFAEVARRRRCPRIFLGHHADDLVETFLMNLFRGTGSEGLRSIRPISTHHRLTVIRPILETWREQIDEYVARHRLKFREDPSNRSLQATRNRIRHRIIPFLGKEFGRGISQSIRRAATIAADEEKWLSSLLPMPSSTAELAVADVRDQPVAVQRRMVRRWLRAQGVGQINFELVERVRALFDPQGDVAKTNLPGDRHVRRRAGKIFLE